MSSEIVKTGEVSAASVAPVPSPIPRPADDAYAVATAAAAAAAAAAVVPPDSSAVAAAAAAVPETTSVTAATAASESKAPTAVTSSAPRAPAPAPVAASAAPTPSAGAKGGSKSKKKKSQVTVTMATAATAQTSGQGAQGENTGRWTAEEHRLFLQGLEQHGKGWKKIASLIKSRTVVQIRTHAQKYFQKLAKARQNGEEGDVTMEGRGGTAVVPAASSSAAQTSKRRRQTSGTKRKAIQSVVSSAQRQGKKIASQQASPGVPNPTAPLPAVSPALSHYVLPSSTPVSQTTTTNSSSTTTTSTYTQAPSCVPSITTAQGTISGPALEDSLFRFLSPAPVAPPEPQVNEVARQAGANPITVPSDNPSSAPSAAAPGEISPTGVADFSIYPSWTDAKDTPSWYAKGSDVDALLDVADSLDWLDDTGDLHESYNPPPAVVAEPTPVLHEPTTTESVAGTEHVPVANDGSASTPDTSVDVVVPPLPSLFDGTADDDEVPKDVLSSHHLTESASTNTIDEHLHVFDTPLEEHDFVSTILESTGESSASLPVLG